MSQTMRVVGLVCLAACGEVKTTPDAGPGVDAPGSVDAAIDASVDPCDPNRDGLEEAASCQTGQTFFRFVNATANDVLSVYANGAANPVTTQLMPKGQFTVGPVDIGLHTLEFRGLQIASGEINTMNGQRWTAVAYRPPGNQPLTLASGDQLAPGACGASSAQVAFGQFTTIASNPAVILYSTNGGTSWVAPISPGLNTGQIFGSGCWNGGSALLLGIGPANTTTPSIRYAPVTFTGGLTYQLLMTDSEIIRIDNLNRVDRFARQ